MSKRTFQPKVKKRKTSYGFLTRMKSDDGREIINRRRRKGRKSLSV